MPQQGRLCFRTSSTELLPAIDEVCNEAVRKAFVMFAVFGAMAFVAVLAVDLKGKVDFEVSTAATKEKKQLKQNPKYLEAAAKAQA